MKAITAKFMTPEIMKINNPNKASWITGKPGMSFIYDMLRKHAPLPLIYQHETINRPKLDGFGYYEFLGGMMVWCISHQVGERAISKIADLNTPVADYISEIKNIDDKYVDYREETNIDVQRVLLLPGSELLRYLVDRNELTQLANQIPNTYIKPHPITTASDLNLLGQIGKLLPIRTSASRLIKTPGVEIASSSCSTLAFQAKLNNKAVISLDYQSETRTYRATYERFAPFLYGDVESSLLASILSSPLSGYFHPETVTEQDIKDYFDFHMELDK